VTAGAPDLVGIVEALYTPNLSPDGWLRVVSDALRPLLDQYGQGMSAMLFNCPDPCSFTPTHALLTDVPEELQAAFFEGMQTFPALFVADSFLTKSCFLCAETKGWNEIGIVADGSGAARGFADGISLTSTELGGAGCSFGSSRPERTPVARDLFLALTRVAKHLAAAHRIRRNHPEARVAPDAAEAVLDVGGRVQHAREEAKDEASRDELGRATRRMEQVRRRRPGSDPSEGIRDWKSVVAQRWTLLEHFENDGKRLMMAVANRAAPPSVDLLSPRERRVVLRAIAGASNKTIAYELGLAASTVRVLMSRAMRKVGARTRRELLDRMMGKSVDS
jgi:DNA-binding CsgD family transcriptional regulator